MVRKIRWFKWLDLNGRGSTSVPDEAIGRALAQDRSGIADQDPDTARQWNLLRARIEQSSRATSAPRPASYTYRFKPGIAIALGSLAVLAGVVLFWPSPAAAPHFYQTGVGQRSTIVLADSTEVTLNHTSTLALLPLKPGEGRRTVLRGEAFFKVRRTGTPFIVETDFGAVTVLGTEFNVRTRHDENEVAVVHGKVEVTSSHNGRDSTVLLNAGQLTMFTRGEVPGAPQRLLFAQDYPGWMNGKFLFNQTSLSSACREIADQFSVPVRTEAPKFNTETITGVVDGRNVESAIKTLCLLSGTSYRHENNGYVLY
jgi:ferric-dicitrate binding protein FerR (iron transport regulator)